MIIVMNNGAKEEQIEGVVKKIGEYGLDANISRGTERTVIGAIGDERKLDQEMFDSLPGVVIMASVKTTGKTGVEMEALAAASTAALTLYDMLKIIDETMEISSVKLAEKKGGKSDFKLIDLKQIQVSVLVLSDKGARGERKDQSGLAIKERLKSLGVSVLEYKILPDDQDQLRAELFRLCDEVKMDLVLTTGGTGLSPRDTTPEATDTILDRTLPGVSERLRSYGQERNPLAMLSRATAGVRRKTVVVNLPGSLNAVTESMDALFPWLFHSFDMLQGKEH